MALRTIAQDVLRPTAVALAPLALMAAVAPSIRLGPAASALVALAAVAVAIAAGLFAAPSRALPGRVVAVTVVVGLGLVALALRLPPVPSGLAGSLGLLAVACVLGGAVGSRMESSGHLTAVASSPPPSTSERDVADGPDAPHRSHPPWWA